MKQHKQPKITHTHASHLTCFLRITDFLQIVCSRLYKESEVSVNPPLVALLIESTVIRKWSHHSRKYQNKISGRTPVKSTIWSQSGWKYRIEIFSCRATKICKKSWRETLCTTGIKFRSEILSPGQIWKYPQLLVLSRILVNICYLKFFKFAIRKT